MAPACACRKDGVVLSLMGTEATFEVLNVMEYSSARGRMSVIARAPDGSIRLFCKGADTKVLGILNSSIDKAFLDNTNSNLHLFATQVCMHCCRAQQQRVQESIAIERGGQRVICGVVNV